MKLRGILGEDSPTALSPAIGAADAAHRLLGRKCTRPASVNSKAARRSVRQFFHLDCWALTKQRQATPAFYFIPDAQTFELQLLTLNPPCAVHASRLKTELRSPCRGLRQGGGRRRSRDYRRRGRPGWGGEATEGSPARARDPPFQRARARAFRRPSRRPPHGSSPGSEGPLARPPPPPAGRATPWARPRSRATTTGRPATKGRRLHSGFAHATRRNLHGITWHASVTTSVEVSISGKRCFQLLRCAPRPSRCSSSRRSRSPRD